MSITRFLGQLSLVAVALGAPIRSSALQAQTGGVEEGARVRVHTAVQRRGDYWIGTVRSLSRDTIVVQLDGTDQRVAISYQWIEELLVTAGIGHAGRPATGLGAFLGLVAGAIFGMATYDDTTCPAPQTPDDELFCDDTSPRLGRAAVIGLLGAGLGAGFGFLVGTQFPRERWRAIDADGSTLLGATRKPSFLIGATVVFRP